MTNHSTIRQTSTESPRTLGMSGRRARSPRMERPRGLSVELPPSHVPSTLAPQISPAVCGSLRRNTTFNLNQAEGGADWDEPPPQIKDDSCPSTSPRDVTSQSEFEMPRTPHGTTSSSGEEAFSLAEAGKVAELQQLLHEDATAASFVSPVRGRTPLLASSLGGHAGCVIALVQAGAPPDQANTSGVAPLHVAAAQGHVKCVRLLLRAGASRL